jgi:fibro-slime domain-containing protein
MNDRVVMQSSARWPGLMVLLAIAPLSSLGCGQIDRRPAANGTPDAGGENPTIDGSTTDGGVARWDLASREVFVVPVCGDGRIDPASNEACDDGNRRGGDGCAADCRSIEPDFACPTPGKPCVYQVKCGDGVLGGTEQCDPPNVGMGCTAGCQLEAQYICVSPSGVPDPSTPSHCQKTVYGDGKKEGGEACDDGNLIDGDGCSATCSLEPRCTAGFCDSKCGDDIKLAPEACDDGNTRNGDGCSDACQIESGFSCVDMVRPAPDQLDLRVTYRDFISLPVNGAVRHPDFEAFSGSGATLALVKTVLDVDGKPAMDGKCATPGTSPACPNGQQLTTDANFQQWYRDTADVNVPVSDALLLPRLANGSYVFDSGEGFYPVDKKGWMATTPPRETSTHNYGFTTEVRYFFQYRGGELLSFSGDDDVWIFINRKLALDLGGLHTTLHGDLNLDQSAAALGLTVGGLYEIALFQAERHSTGSNFKLTLTGFAPTSSTCRSACGDGVRASTEQCDDGNTVDGDGCSHDCVHEVVIE